MFIDAFTKCPSDEISSVLGLLNKVLPNNGFREAGLIVLRKNLSFYKDAVYYDLSQADQHPGRFLQIVVGAGHVFICDGNLDKLLAFNQTYPLTLDRTLVLDYIRFYFNHVIGMHDKTLVVDTVEDLGLEEEPTPGLRKSLADKIIPLGVQASIPDGGYQIRGTILIRQTLYTAVFDVQVNGTVEASSHKVIADLLPVYNRILEG